VKLLELKLENFKGIKEFTLNTEGEDVEVLGTNETGKSTLFDAFLWLLFGRDSRNQANAQVKTLKEGNPIHGLDHSVEALLELADGKNIKLKKIYKEKWEKKRGQSEAQFSGHTTTYEINDRPDIKQKEFNEKISEIAGDEQVFRLVTDPLYFNEGLTWKERRKLIFEVCGDIPPEEIIEATPELEGIEQEYMDVLLPGDYEEAQKALAAKKKKTNQRLEEIRVRVDENNKNMPKEVNFNEGELKTIQKQIDELKEKRSQAFYTGYDEELNNKITELKQEISDLREQARKEFEEQGEELRKARNDAQYTQDHLKSLINRNKNRLQEIAEEKAKVEDNLNKLAREWELLYHQEFELNAEDDDTHCPTCGQMLPYDEVHEAQQKAEENFKKKKAEDLEENEQAGKALADKKATLEEEEAKLKQEKEQNEKSLGSTTTEISQIEKKIDDNDRQRLQVSDSPEIKKMQEEIDRLVQKQGEAKTTDTTEYDEKIAKLQEREEELQEVARQQRQLEEIKDRVSLLLKEERHLGEYLNELEKQEYLIETFIKEKVKLTKERVNQFFNLPQFKLFEYQINGGIRETCETLYKGVPYSVMNWGARINIGLDIINTLSKHYDFRAPIFVDNAEAVAELVETEAQQIPLYMKPEYDSLEVVVKGEEKKEDKKATLF